MILSASACEVTRTSISADARAGDDVGRRATLDDADIERRPGRRVLELLDAEDLVGQLDDRAAAVLGGHAGMGRLAVDFDVEPAHAFRAVLRPPFARAGSSTRT